METLLSILGQLDLSDAIVGLMGLLAGALAALIKGTKTKLDDKAVKSLSEQLADKLKDE